MSKRVFGSFIAITIAGLVIFSAVDANSAITKFEESNETIKYTTDTIYDSNMREGTTEVKQEGKNGNKNVTYKVTYKYDKEVNRTVESEEIIEPAVNKTIVKGTKKYYTCDDGSEYDNYNDKAECDKKVAWAKQRDASLQECYADSSKYNCWYDEYPGTTLHWEERTYNGGGGGGGKSGRTGAICRDGWHSSATGRGACSHHGGVSYWLY